MVISSETCDRLRRSSNVSNESDSLFHLRHSSEQAILKKRPKYSIYNLKHNRSRQQSIRTDHQRVRRHSERLTFHRHQPSLAIARRTQHLHYITYKHEEKNNSRSSTGLLFTPIGYSARTTRINGNGMHRTTSDCSNWMQGIIKTNDKHQQQPCFRTWNNPIEFVEDIHRSFRDLCWFAHYEMKTRRRERERKSCLLACSFLYSPRILTDFSCTCFFSRYIRIQRLNDG